MKIFNFHTEASIILQKNVIASLRSNLNVTKSDCFVFTNDGWQWRRIDEKWW